MPERLREALEEWGFTLSDLSKYLVGFHRASVPELQGMLNGTLKPHPLQLEGICDHLCVRKDWLEGTSEVKRTHREEFRKSTVMRFDQRRRDHPKESPALSALMALKEAANELP